MTPNLIPSTPSDYVSRLRSNSVFSALPPTTSLDGDDTDMVSSIFYEDDEFVISEDEDELKLISSSEEEEVEEDGEGQGEKHSRLELRESGWESLVSHFFLDSFSCLFTF